MNKPLKIPPHVLAEQYASSDPAVSAWVAANAGSGKTHVLTQRVIRLMLAGNAPDRILCLTFTKAAAANMKTRVFNTLAEWTMMDDEMLGRAVSDISGQEASPKMKSRARCLFAQALDTPGGLKIQTIHAFCESLLHQFPLEANVPGHFETLQETGQAALLEDAKSFILAGNHSTEDTLDHYRQLISCASQTAIEEGIAAIVANRNAFLDWISVGIDTALEPVCTELGIMPSDTDESILQEFSETLPVARETLLEIAAVAGESDKARDHEVHLLLSNAFEEPITVERFSAIETALLTAKGELRSESKIVTKFVKDRLPQAAEQLLVTGEAVQSALERMRAAKLIENSRHLFHVAEAVLERYASLKRRHGVIDFDDQVEKCAALLNRNEIRDWIRYRLDRGIDHVLVDEAQDTSPKQWQIINAITADFHHGESAAVRHRTVFVVGDEKQSIYSFQGARPAEFAKQQSDLQHLVEGAEKPFHPGKLILSFRSTSDVLHAVDLVFDSAENRKGLMQSGEQPVHDAVRAKDPGEVQVWPLFAKEKSDQPESWTDPIDRATLADPAVQLAERIAETIGEWVGKPLPDSDKPLKYQDVLVLVRKRDRFITALTRTMKDRGLKVAGADRLTLTDHIAVEDLLALGQFVLLPQDSLNLACVLKGVLFDLEEETLFDFAYDRGDASLYEVICQAASIATHKHAERARAITDKLAILLKQGRELNVFEFFAWVLGPLGVRKAMLARLGMEAEDVLDAFLDEAISFAREGGIGLESFIDILKRTEPEIKREVELDRDEVRILTVHASKGLEARVVFLVDPSNAPWTEKHRPAILPIQARGVENMLWLPSSDLHVTATRKCTEKISSAAQEEYRRLLYVGMTRAADRLVVCGYRGANEPKHVTWHAMVFNALQGSAVAFDRADGTPGGIRWTENPDAEMQVSSVPQDRSDEKGLVRGGPDWLYRNAPQEPALPAPLTPTGAHALIDDTSEPQMYLRQFDPSEGEAFPVQRGRAVHYLLEKLPDVPSENREELGRAYLEKVGADWSTTQREEAWRAVRAILVSEELADLFAGESLAEVSVTGRLKTRTGDRMIAGQIDRLVVEDEVVSIIDYKTNGTIPADPSKIPAQYLSQMALYRELVSQIYPDRIVKCHILWVWEPRMMLLTESLLSSAIEGIKNI